MNVKRRISEIAIELLGSSIYPHAREWDQILDLSRVYGRDEVINCFREWAEVQSTTEAVAKPLTQFLKTAPAKLSGKTMPAQPKVLPCWQHQVEQRLERLEKLVQQLQAVAQ